MFVRPALERGGAEKMLAFVAGSFAEKPGGCKTWLVTTHSRTLGYELPVGVEHISLARGELKPSRRSPAGFAAYVRALFGLRRLVRRLRPDVVCAFGVQYTVLCLVACFGLRARVVGAERGSPMHLGPVWKVLTALAYQLADGVVFQLPSVRAAYPAVARRSVVIANPHISGSEVRREPVRMRRPVVAGAFARWDDSKGVDVLLRAFQRVVLEHPWLSLELIGPRVGAERYQALAAELGIQDSVSFLNLVPDVADAVRDCRVFVLPSRHEGIPNVLLEALGVGVPVVASDCPPGGPRLLTGDGERGLLVPVDDVDAMAMAICRIVEDEVLAARLGLAALAVRSEFSPRSVRAQWIEFFARVVSRDFTGVDTDNA